MAKVLDAREDATALSSTELLQLIETQKSEPRDIPIVVPFSFIAVDESFNTRGPVHGYGSGEEQAALVESIITTGQQQTMSVIASPLWTSAQPLYLTAGFRRARAFGVISRRLRIDPSVMVVLKAFPGETWEARETQAKLANLATDGTVPIRSWDVAQRLRYFRGRTGMSVKKIAAAIGKSEAYVTDHLYCLERLSPEVKRLWAAAPTAQYEIPMKKLREWARYGHSTQKELLDRYIGDSDEPLYIEDERGQKKRIDKRPRMRLVRTELERIKFKLKNMPKGTVEWAHLDGARRALAFTMGDLDRIFREDPSARVRQRRKRS